MPLKDNFVHLHCHSQFSLLDGSTRIADLVQTAKAFGMPALALTDHGNMYAAVQFALAAKEAGIKIKGIMAGGGAAKNNSLMQFLSDVLGSKISRLSIPEASALGVSFMAGVSVKFFKNMQDIRKLAKIDKVYAPVLSGKERTRMLKGWARAVKLAIAYSSS